MSSKKDSHFLCPQFPGQASKGPVFLQLGLSQEEKPGRKPLDGGGGVCIGC